MDWVQSTSERRN